MARGIRREKIQVNISVLGDKELQAKLAALPGRAQRALVGKAMTKGSRLIRDEARRFAPVLTGRMKKSIRTRKFSKTRRGSFGTMVSTGTRAELGISSDNKYYYPMILEKHKDTNRRREFMGPAFRSSREQVLAIIKSELKRALR